MARDIDFAALDLQDALDLAILIEDEAEERYQELAVQMETYCTPEAARFFRYMAGNEEKHGKELRTRREARFGAAPARVDRDMLWEIEAPAYESTRAFMSARAALDVALTSEIKAQQYFTGALPHLRDPEVKVLFEELRVEEIEHQRMVKKEMAKLPADLPLDPEEFVDEPPAL